MYERSAFQMRRFFINSLLATLLTCGYAQAQPTNTNETSKTCGSLNILVSFPTREVSTLLERLGENFRDKLCSWQGSGTTKGKLLDLALMFVQQGADKVTMVIRVADVTEPYGKTPKTLSSTVKSWSMTLPVEGDGSKAFEKAIYGLKQIIEGKSPSTTTVTIKSTV
jgi:hypothetical protein